MNMLEKIMKHGKPEIEVKRRTPAKRTHDKSAKWALRYPSTPYDKYIVEQRAISGRKRGNAWFELSGGKDLREEKGKGYYKRIVEESSRDMSSKDAIQIEKDLLRTSIKGKAELTEDEVSNLREVLKAVSYELRLEGGYCQSMNFIAALLLSHMDNELAFYTQICMTRDLFNGYFTDELFGMRVDERIFAYLLSEKLPELTDHFSDCDISLTNVTFHWFLCLFINVLPLEVTEFIWDRIFYFGSHVIHAASMSLFIQYQRELMRIDDIEDLVVFFAERLPTVSISMFAKMDQLGVTLPRVRIMRIDYAETMRNEEKEMKRAMAHSLSMTSDRQRSMRMSMTRLASTKDLSNTTSNELVLSCQVIVSIKEAVARYVINHCAESFGVAPERLSNKQVRDYCYAGFSQDEFLSLWSMLMRDGVIPSQDQNVYLELFNQYKRQRSGSCIVDIREVLIGLMFIVSEPLDASVRLFYFFGVFDFINEGTIPRCAFCDLITAVYEKCPQITDVARAAEKYVSIVFAVNTQQPDTMSFQEFRSIVLMQPQIATFLHIVDVSLESEESVESPTESAEVGDPLHLKELPAVLAQHPFVRSAVNLPEGFQRDLGAFLQDMAIIVQERDKLKEVIRQGNGASAYRNSIMKSIRLSSNRLMSMQMPMSVSDNSNMEMIREDDDSVQSGQPSSPTTHPDEMRKEKVVDMKMSVRRRF
ncbi:hypothetical protein WA588_006134 [Blastocystis sp. NMH]